ncbi:hypothetical protein LTR23_010282 [Exophiala sp. CCFEE 6169]|nr:hypothetical protein LTR23_010282 [Chaetothyriales sp. CCFEE 6169]
MDAPFNSTSLRFRNFCHTNNDMSSPPSIDTRSGHIPDDVDTIMSRTNESRTSNIDAKLQCCCGRPECAYLENNNTLLGGIERDLETAAKLGQALLNRHESYVNESQLEHERLTAYINEIEKERNTLQAANEKIVEENRGLLDQLESANNSLKESDNHVKSLEALLRDCEVEVRRLNDLSRRTEELELKVLDMERERITLSEKVEESEEETRSTIQRWKESVLKVRQLEYEVQRIEWEAKQDRQRHEDIIARLERERAIERELGGAEGRLKGAAALQTLSGKSAAKSNVVSHFVRDILQDNANLQAGIAELRELLQSSNEEVQNLREQVLHHQAVDYDNPMEEPLKSTPLSEELGWAEPSPKQVQQEVHVHHHYHAKIAGRRDRTPTLRKSSRKRPIFGLGTLPATPESSAPTTPLSGPHRHISSPILPLALHYPQPRYNRWSVQSAATGSTMQSSFPSSPRSYYEPSSSIFDRLEAEEESSRPTSPESAAGFSESRYKSFQSRFAEASPDPLEEEDFVDEPELASDSASDLHYQTSLPTEGSKSQDTAQDLTPKPSQMLVTVDRIPAEEDPGPTDIAGGEVGLEDTKATPVVTKAIFEASGVESSASTSNWNTGDVTPTAAARELRDTPDSQVQMRHRRTNSHESLVSISGMDIHIAQRPTTATSQSSSFLKGNRAYFALSPSVARRLPAAQPLTTVTEFTALSSPRSVSTGSIPTVNTVPSQSIEALSGLAGIPKPVPQEQSGGFGRFMGGWVRGKWGMAPMKSTSDLKSPMSGSTTSLEAQPPTVSLFPSGRMPGINQKGAIPGFKPRRVASSGVQMKMVDEDGLQESLAG